MHCTCTLERDETRITGHLHCLLYKNTLWTSPLSLCSSHSLFPYFTLLSLSLFFSLSFPVFLSLSLSSVHRSIPLLLSLFLSDVLFPAPLFPYFIPFFLSSLSGSLPLCSICFFCVLDHLPVQVEDQLSYSICQHLPTFSLLTKCGCVVLLSWHMWSVLHHFSCVTFASVFLSCLDLSWQIIVSKRTFLETINLCPSKVHGDIEIGCDYMYAHYVQWIPLNRATG